ncbi:hypothetical protein [Candidatus Absconditicoccus praedator]|uniref:hypothetical protein n=1 Tax=Candidatus Absconditicoccus praedator TaxID=2735562 RepID=UPI001E4423D4|nr:hypothetical protein [Candidatus Absconditicoccus praedator]UFX82638.1 hypothetical protein HLG78_00600 [Candidatus Absconditicoccus praedator]
MKDSLCILKFGSETICPENTSWSQHVENFRKQIGNVISSKKEDMDFVVVSSGAAKLGRMFHGENMSNDALMASLGQPELINFWKEVVGPKVGQILINYVPSIDINSMETSQRIRKILSSLYDNIKTQQDKNIYDTIVANLGVGSIPVCNYNDSTDRIEIEGIDRLEDNDYNSGYVAELMRHYGNWENIYLVTYSNSPLCEITQDGQFVIPYVNPDKTPQEEIAKLCNGKSSSGRGGMKTKTGIHHWLVSNDIVDKSVIADTSSDLATVLGSFDRSVPSDKFTTFSKN